MGVFTQLIFVAENVGTVKAANMYNDEFMTIEGVTQEGKKFSITLSIKEEKKDA